MELNSIVLRLLGSFYKHSRDSFVTRGIDKIYSQLMFDRYVFTARREMMLSDGTIPIVPMMGYINIEDVDIPTKTIRITSISGENIELNGENIISFMYLDAKKFYSCEDGVLSDDGYKELEGLWDSSDSLPIVYHKDKSMRMTTFASSLSNEKDVSFEILRLLSSMSIFNKNSIGSISSMVNIMLGAKYYIGDAVVEEIIGGNILIKGTEYTVNKDYISVVEGQSISGITLLETPILVEFSTSSSIEMTKINNLINDSTSSSALKEYLRAVGLKVSKRMIVANIPISTISETSTATLNALGGIVTQSSTFGYTSESIEKSNIEEVLATESPTLKVKIPIKIELSEDSKIILNIHSSSNIQFEEDAVFAKTEEEFVSASGIVGELLPYEMMDNATIHYNEEYLTKLIEDELLMSDDEGSTSFAKQTSHNIVDVVSDDEMIMLGASDATLGDMVANGIYKEGIFSGKDSFSAIDNLLVKNDIGALEEIMISSIQETKKLVENLISPIDKLTSSTIVNKTDYIGSIIGDEVKVVTSALLISSVVDKTIIEVSPVTIGTNITDKRVGKYDVLESVYSSDVSSTSKVSTFVTIGVEDIADVSTDVEIDGE
ncbi:hypothetical protein JHD46_08305 [Sulfurimonas sp. SAG-AH-194-C20]|nr:hypothetical protein [Sulfurimonas sp. SAG-AH-194-C20]MDF1879636.1 hypothetical protein [Sulfurimonas sp. SAG-AH-194-C20]